MSAAPELDCEHFRQQIQGAALPDPGKWRPRGNLVNEVGPKNQCAVIPTRFCINRSKSHPYQESRGVPRDSDRANGARSNRSPPPPNGPGPTSRKICARMSSETSSARNASTD